MFSEFQNILGNLYHTTWHEVLNEHSPEPLEEASTYSRDKKEDFEQAIKLLLQRCLIIKTARLAIHLYGLWRQLPHCKGPTYLAARAFTPFQGDAPALPSFFRRATS